MERRAVHRAQSALRRAARELVGARMPVGMRHKLGIFHELWLFVRLRKKFWIGSIMFVLILLGTLIVITQGSALAPFIYALF